MPIEDASGTTTRSDPESSPSISLTGSRHVALDLPRRETTATVRITMKHPMTGWHHACIGIELGIMMQLGNPFSHGLDAL